MPDDIAHLEGKQIIGYHGALSDWLDWELINRLAESLPEYTQLVLVGPMYNISEIPEHSRITYTGLKEYKELYRYLQYFDVAIIPFKVTAMTESCCPIKMWEYLSSGVPVVATAIPEAMKHPEVCIGKTTEEFIEQVMFALKDKDIEKKMPGLNWLKRTPGKPEQNKSWKQLTPMLVLVITGLLQIR